jgi:hypothetical protein
MARKRAEAAAKGGKMPLETRIANYLAGERNRLTPRQIRRAAHKAHVSTDQVRDQAAS